jgi:hypothetical protein
MPEGCLAFSTTTQLAKEFSHQGTRSFRAYRGKDPFDSLGNWKRVGAACLLRRSRPQRDTAGLFAEITALWGYGTSGRESSGSLLETLKRSTSWIPSARKPSE